MPPDAVEPLFKQVVNQFVHDRSRTEVSRYCFVAITFCIVAVNLACTLVLSGHRCWTECGEGDMSTNAFGIAQIQ